MSTRASTAVLDDRAWDFMSRIVSAARGYLGAEVGFLAEFDEGEKVIRIAAGQADEAGLGEGTRFPLESTYCHRVARGQIPEAIYDTAIDGRVRDLPITRQLGIRSYIGVPVKVADGVPLGTLCCVNFDAQRREQDRDLAFMRFLADLVGTQVREAHDAQAERRARVARIRAVIDTGGPRMLFQPVVELATGRIVGAEALARFDAEPRRTPDLWFADAWAVGLGAELEIAAVRNALEQMHVLPSDAYLSVNLSPATLLDAGVHDLLRSCDAGRVVVEITEHAAVADYGELAGAIGRMRSARVRLAIDDLGSGYSSLRHVLQVGPDMAKLDMSLTRDIDSDTAKQALTGAVTRFALQTGLGLVAEGIETEAEAESIQALGVRFGQGFFFSRPQALPFGPG